MTLGPSSLVGGVRKRTLQRLASLTTIDFDYRCCCPFLRESQFTVGEMVGATNHGVCVEFLKVLGNFLHSLFQVGLGATVYPPTGNHAIYLVQAQFNTVGGGCQETVPQRVSRFLSRV